MTEAPEYELVVEILTPDCAAGEAYIHRVPADTHWGILQESIELLYPETTEVNLKIVKVEE